MGGEMDNYYFLHTGVFSVNTYIVPIGDAKSSKDVVIFDPAGCALSRDENLLLDFLKRKDYNCRAICLTHAHFDHIMGIAPLKAAFPEAKLYVHQADAAELGNVCGPMNTSILQDFGMMLKVAKVLEEQPAPDQFLKGGEVLFDEWKVIHTPGHSKGSVCYYNEGKGLLVSGDTMFYQSWGRTDMYGGSDAEIKKSLALLKNTVKEGTFVLPGHDCVGFNIEDNR